MKGTNKDYPSPTPGPAQESPKNHIMEPENVSWRLEAGRRGAVTLMLLLHQMVLPFSVVKNLPVNYVEDNPSYKRKRKNLRDQF